MVKINIVAVGKVKEKYFTEGIAEYSKRLKGYCDFTLTEIKEENFDKVQEGTIQKILSTEGERISPFISKGYVFATAIEGKKYSSVEFANKLKSLIDGGEGVITFVIGGSYGIDKKIKERANELISLSDMTFPHTLFRLILTEQIYRAFTINNGTAYHK